MRMRKCVYLLYIYLLYIKIYSLINEKDIDIVCYNKRWHVNKIIHVETQFVLCPQNL